MITSDVAASDPEPDGADLAAIEAEWPLIESEVALVDAEIRVLTATGGPSALDWRRLRRAEQRVLREAVAFLSSKGSAAGVPLLPSRPAA
jgi:hypothetical protein